MSNRTKHLRALLCKDTSFKWTSAHDAEFADLKEALLSPDTMFYYSDQNSTFEVHTDASKHGVRAMLAQMRGGHLHPVKFASRSFTSTESCWPTTHQELFAIKWGLKHFRPYVLGRKLKVVTDHVNLKFLTSISPQQSKLARWCLSMAEFDFVIEHRPCIEQAVPNTLRQAPLSEPSPVGDKLILPPAPISLFFTIMLGYDIRSHQPSLVNEVFSYPMNCLACTAGPPVTQVHSLPTDLNSKVTISQPLTSSVAKGTSTNNMPSQPLNISRAS